MDCRVNHGLIGRASCENPHKLTQPKRKHPLSHLPFLWRAAKRTAATLTNAPAPHFACGGYQGPGANKEEVQTKARPLNGYVHIFSSTPAGRVFETSIWCGSKHSMC